MRYDHIYLDPHKGAVVSAKAYRDHRETGSLHCRFYLAASPGISLKSSGIEPDFLPAPIVDMDPRLRCQLKSIAATAKQFNMRDLMEEFVAAGIWPLSQSWNFPVTPVSMPGRLHTGIWREPCPFGKMVLSGHFRVSLL